ncbi:hypothetical protein EJB05_23104 [Eragrostis curvula]|uniref:Uncharacterized protein n=1 Tax=Eragrostis curvula TaxID=38414 RepID=A0A5J9V953_9POAL|nr:hypothetical protein EJB05_23104 [Eragrostis curvula]
MLYNTRLSTMEKADDQERPLLELLPPQVLVSQYTRDGSVDINKQPALKHSTGNWRACFFILGVEFCECLAFFAISKNLVTYLTTVLHESKISAARNVSTWVGASFLMPLIGAFIADTYWGRYWTIVGFLPVYIFGVVVLIASASLPVFSKSPYNGDAHRAAVYFGLYLVAIGSGGVKPCTSTFGADQFDINDTVELAKKGSFFNWYYFMVSASSLLSGTIIVWLQDNVSWAVGYAIPLALMLFSLAVFVAGSRVYRYRRMGISPLTSLCQVIVAAVRKWDVQLPDDSSLLYELTSSSSESYETHKIQHTYQFRFFDKAAIVSPCSDSKSIAPMSKWSLCTVTQVEELKMLLRMWPIWVSFVIFYAVSAQIASTMIEQGMFMDNCIFSFAIPPASLSILSMFSVLVWVPVYETILVPLARRFTGNDKGFSQPQRLGIGFVFSMLSMVYAALLETRRLAIAEDRGLKNQSVPVPMSIMWQVPVYLLHGVAEVFAVIGVTEFFYDQAPETMKSLCAALGQVAIATGSFFNSLILGLVAIATTRRGAPGWIPDNLNQGHLDYFFWMMATLSFLNLAQQFTEQVAFASQREALRVGCWPGVDGWREIIRTISVSGGGDGGKTWEQARHQCQDAGGGEDELDGAVSRAAPLAGSCATNISLTKDEATFRDWWCRAHRRVPQKKRKGFNSMAMNGVTGIVAAQNKAAMETTDVETPLIYLQLPQVEGSEYTSDGSVDINKQPVLKHGTGGWRACFFILGVEFCDCMAFDAISKNLVTYLATVLHESKVAAATNVDAWVGACFFTPLIGTFIADNYWGRYWTIFFFFPIYIVAMLGLIASASVPLFSTSPYNGHLHHAVVYLGLYLAAIGNGGVKSCTLTFGADQFDINDSVELAKKGSFFSWFYFLVNTSSLLSGTVIVWLQDNVGWAVSYAIPLVLMLFSLAVFVAGSRVYRFRRIGISPCTSLSQVIVAAVRKRHLQLPDDSSLLYELTGSPSAADVSHKIKHTDQLRFFEKAAIISASDNISVVPMSSWMLCTVTQVEELKMMLRMSPTWASLVIFYAISAQMASTLVEQAMFMDNRIYSFTIPPACLATFSVISILILVPVYETVLVPLARHFTGEDKGFSQQQRLGIGLALSILTMVYAALLETWRLEIAEARGLKYQSAPVPMTILWQIPLHLVHGVAGVFSSIGANEFFYDNAPESMKSLGTTLGQLVYASGSCLSSLILGVVAVATTRNGTPGWTPDNLNEGHLDYFFWMMVTLRLLNLALFVHRSMRYREKTSC